MAATQAELDHLENIWVLLLASYKPSIGYNLTYGGHSAGRPTPETREKQRRVKTGVKYSEDSKRKRSESGKKAWAEGRNKGNQGKRISEANILAIKSRCGPKHPNFNHKANTEEMTAWWNSGMQMKDISAKVGLSAGQIRRRIRKSGLPHRQYHTEEGRRVISETAKQQRVKIAT